MEGNPIASGATGGKYCPVKTLVLLVW